MYDAIVVNDAMFCEAHLREFCNHCQCDYRMGNNVILQIASGGARASEMPKGINLDERPALDASKTKPIKTQQKHGAGDSCYKCSAHSAIDCKECFDWIKTIKETHSNPVVDNGQISDRKTLLALLRSMGIDLTASKTNESGLEKRLGAALKYAQNVPEEAHLPIDPLKLPVWDKTRTGLPLQDVMNRGSIKESMQRMANPAFNGAELYTDPFSDLRQTVRSIGNTAELGQKWCGISHKDGDEEAIFVGIITTRVLPNGSPVLVVHWKWQSAFSPDDCKEIMTVGPEMMRESGKGMSNIQCTLTEIRLLKKLLHQNAALLDPSYSPTVPRWKRTFKMSVLMPMGPLDQIALGKLSSNLGCAICGGKGRVKCSTCRSVRYCGPECQKLDWADHKRHCKLVQAGTFRPVPFKTAPTIDGKAQYSFNFNYSGSPSDLKGAKYQAPEDFNKAQPNVHGSEPFLIKIQRPLTGGAWTTMAIYDAGRTFQAFLNREEAPQMYREMISDMGDLPKMYRYGKRTGDLELSILLNVTPLVPQIW